MPSDHALAMRQAIVKALRAAPNLTAVIPSGRIYGEESPANPEFPFIRYGLPVTNPYEASCGNGSEHAITLHTFSYGPGTDSINVINALVVDALKDAALSVDPLKLISFDWTGSQVLRDTPEASNYHGVLRFTAQTLET